METTAETEAFDRFLENMGEDDGDDLLGLAEIAFHAGWGACLAWMTRPENIAWGEPEERAAPQGS